MPASRIRALAFLATLGLAVGAAGAPAYAAFFSVTSNGQNSFAADGDWMPPTASSVVARSGAFAAGSIKQGAQYFVYANATDPSGVASVTTDVSSITTGQTAVTLATTGGPWTIDAVSYAYRNAAALTANNPLAEGARSYTLTATDGHTPANTGTQTFSVTVDNTDPAGADVQTANGGTTAGKPEAGDTITFTFGERMEPSSILAGWTGTSTAVQVSFRANSPACPSGNNSVTVLDSGGGSGVKLGLVCLGRNDYVNGNRTFASSSMLMSGNSVVVTLGGTATTTQAQGTGRMSWTPDAAAADVAGNTCSTTAVNEAEPPVDAEF